MTHFIFGQHFLKRMLVLTGLLLNVGGQLIAQSICLSSHNDYVFEGTSNAQCIDYGDFDNNGVKDIVEGNFTSGTNKMVLIKGNANGTFQAPIPFEGNSRPLDVKAADFNLDGNLDVVVANQLDATISVVFGNGNGTFQTPVTYTTSLSPNDIAIGDFNEDSYKDLAVSCLNGGVNIFFGSSVTFGQFTSGGYFATGAGARGVVTKDFNQDGNLDIATSNNSAASMTVIFGNGSGSFSGTVTIAAQTGAFSIISGDFNGDSKLDLACTNETANTVSVALNSATGFSSATHYPTKAKPNGIKVGDFNEDNFPDLAIVCYQDNVFSVFKGTSSGVFLPATNFTAIGSPRDLVVYDANNDNFDDAVISSGLGAVLPVFIGLGNGDFQRKASYPVGNGANSIHHADMDGDGDKDILVANSTDNNLQLLKNNGLGVFNTAGTFSTDLGPNSVYAALINGDAYYDVVIANTTNGTITVLINDGAGNLTSYGNFTCNAGPVVVKAGDVNNDTKTDIVVLNNTGNFNVLLGTGTGFFAAPVTYSIGNTPSDLELGLLNGDNYLDIAVTISGNSKLGISLNSGSGTFGTVNQTNLGTNPKGLALGDINNDGKMDIVVANYGANNFIRLIGSGTGTFSPVVTFTSTDTGPVDALLADFNNDGKLDVIGVCEVSVASTGYAPVFTGNGTGTFTFYKRFSTDMGPKLGTVADWNNDGRIDAAVVNNTSKSVTVHMNTTAQITVNGPLVYCDGAGTILTATPATSYLWSNSATTPSIAPTISGDYYVTTTAGFSNWCSSQSQTVTITVSSSPALTLTDNMTLCQGQTATLVASGATTYLWSDGLGTSSTATVSPSTTHEYFVTGFGPNGCSKTDSVTITITTVPDATFTSLNPIYCQSANPVTLVPVTSGGTFSGSGVSGNTFNPALATPGTVVVSYYVNLGGGCAGSSSQTITVATNPNSNFTGLNNSYCLNSSASNLVPTVTGGTFSGSGISGSSFNPGSAGVGTHTISYTVVNASGCTSTSAQTTIVNSIPSANFTGLAASYCSGGTPSTLTPATSGGTFSGSGGIVGSTFNPASATIGSNTIVYTVTGSNGCSNSSVQTTIVNQSPNATYSGLSNSYCVGGASSTLVPVTSGGVFSGPGMSGSVFSPTSAGAGTHTIIYQVTVSGCTSQYSLTTTVNALPNATFTGLNTSYCSGNPPVTLTPATPGGVFSGNGMSGSTFSPANAAIGSNTITYIITNSFGCTNQSSQTTNVVQGPNATFTGLAAHYCFDNSTNQPLSAVTNGGTFTGPGMQGPNFKPSNSQVGLVTITYTVTQGGCTSVYSAQTTVHADPDASFTDLNNGYCNLNDPIALTGVVGGGVFSGPGVSGSIFNPFNAGIGTHTITYNVTDAYGCSNQSSQSVQVIAKPIATFTGLNPSYCINQASSTLTPTQAGGTFSGSGISGSVFNPANAGVGSHVITYQISNAYCTQSTNQTTQVNALPVVNFSGLNQTYCTADNPSTLIPSPSGGTFSGTGVSGNQFSPAGLSGTYTIQYSYTNTNGCSNSTSQTTQVVPTYDPYFSGLNSTYCSNDAPVTMTPVVSGGVFSGPGVTGNQFFPEMGSTGANQVTYSVGSGNCAASYQYTTVVIQAPNSTVTVGTDALYGQQQSGVTYQWYNCSTMSDVPGATSSMFTTTVSGSYALIVSNSLCSDTSNCISISAGLDDHSYFSLSFYPNPSSGNLMVNTEEALKLEIIDMSGRLVFEVLLESGLNQFDLKDVSRGMYHLHFTNKSGLKQSYPFVKN